jgi:hypothetical protein
MQNATLAIEYPAIIFYVDRKVARRRKMDALYPVLKMAM